MTTLKQVKPMPFRLCGIEIICGYDKAVRNTPFMVMLVANIHAAYREMKAGYVSKEELIYHNSVGWSVLHYLANYGYLIAPNSEVVVKELLIRGVMINKKTNRGMTALMLVAMNGMNKMESTMKLLLECKNIQVNWKSNNGNTALMYACQNKNENMLKMLLEHPKISINPQNKQGRTALIVCAINMNMVGMALLLKKKAIDVNRRDSSGWTALMYLCYRDNNNDRLEMIKMLLKHPKIDVNVMNNKMNNALILSAECLQSDVVALLIKHPGIEVNKYNVYGHTALTAACRKTTQDDMTVMRLLLDHPDIDVNCHKNGKTLMMYAKERGLDWVVRRIEEINHVSMKVSDECAVCTNLIKQRYALITCGHSSICETCIDECMKKTAECPLCRKNIKGKMRIY